jgi:hypothetical protein
LHYVKKIEIECNNATFPNQVTPLVKPISTVKARGQVDKWLVELEIQMRLSLKQQVRIV